MKVHLINSCALDISKIFDRVDYGALICKLIEKKLPKFHITILCDWCTKCEGIVYAVVIMLCDRWWT